MALETFPDQEISVNPLSEDQSLNPSGILLQLKIEEIWLKIIQFDVRSVTIWSFQFCTI